jgi:glycerol-3-phosphate dehydrogenase
VLRLNAYTHLTITVQCNTTGFGGASRNRTVGVRLGKGETLAAVIASMNEVAEGVPTASAAVALCDKHGLDSPIVRAVADIVAGKLSPTAAMHALMTSDQRVED